MKADFLDIRLKVNFLLYFLSIAIVEFLCFYYWSKYMYTPRFLNPDNYEFYAVENLENIILFYLPVFSTALGLVVTREKWAAPISVLISTPAIIILSLNMGNKVIQAYENDYWFYFPAVIMFLFIQTLACAILSLIVSYVIRIFSLKYKKA